MASAPTRQPSVTSKRQAPQWIWPLLTVLVASAPLAGGFSWSNIFYMRDLSMFFWPRHLWIRTALQAGRWPLWDPYASAGQAAFPDALNQLFLPPVLLLRVLFPAVLGFNLIVIAPFPLAALGMWFFLRRYVSPVSAALGGIVFSASGPVISTSDFPNLSWSVAWIPWLLWAVDRDRAAPSIRSFSLVAAVAALQMLSGEPVTMAGTLALCGAYATLCGDRSGSPGHRARAAFRIVAAVAVAVAVSAVQLIPMALAARSSFRGQMRPDNFWSVHPLAMVETVLPHVFGDTFYRYNAQLPWIYPLNSGREPFFYSLYVGPVVLLLSVLGALSGPRRWSVFWLAVAVAALVLAFGDYTPAYPALQQLVPVVRTFRFPAKFLIFVSLGLAVLAAEAVQALQAPRESGEAIASGRSAVRATVAAGAIGSLVLITLISLVIAAPYTGARMFYALGKMIGVADPVAGAEFLFHSLPPIAARVLFLLLTSALLAYLGWAAKREARLARALLFALAVGELIVVSAGVNPVMPASALTSPAWTTALRPHSGDRFYFGGKFGGALVQHDIDLRGVRWQAPRAATVGESRTLMIANLVMTPAAWGVRELLSYDLPALWPIEQYWAITQFERASAAARARFLARGGVRYCLLAPAAAASDARPIQAVGEGFGEMAVYECGPNARRAFVVPEASVEPNVASQLSRLFDESVDAEATVMLAEPPPPAAGSRGTPEVPSARILQDDDETVAIEASTGAGGGYLVLADSFDSSWRVDVDGFPAPLLRADALYRAVRLQPGRHTVRFTYKPIVLYACAIVSGLTASSLAASALWSVWRRRQAADVASASAQTAA